MFQCHDDGPQVNSFTASVNHMFDPKLQSSQKQDPNRQSKLEIIVKLLSFTTFLRFIIQTLYILVSKIVSDIQCKDKEISKYIEKLF